MLAAANVYGLTVWDVRKQDPILQMTSSQPGYEPAWLSRSRMGQSTLGPAGIQ